MTKKHRTFYFWSFYKWQILAGLVILILGIYFLYTALSQKECALSVMLIDCHTDQTQEQMEQELLKALQLDPEQYSVSLQNNLMFNGTDSGSYAMTSLSRFLADLGSEKLDVCGMLETDFWKYEQSGTFLDLRECFTKEELQALAEFLIIAEDGRVVGLWANHLPRMQENNCYDDASVRGAIGIIYQTKHLSAAKKYLLYLSGQTDRSYSSAFIFQ